MAIKYIRLGSSLNVFGYDDTVFTTSLSVDDPIEVTVPPTSPAHVLRLEDLGGMTLIAVSVANIDDPSTELNALESTSGGTILMAYQTGAGPNAFTYYAWDSAVAAGESVPFVVDGLSGFWIAVAGKYSALDLHLMGLTASRLLASGANKELVSVANLASWIAGTANKITVTDDGDGTVTITLPNDVVITTSATVPTIYGSSASGATLTISSTSHATKGKILLGTSAYDEANNRLGVGLDSPQETLAVAGNTVLPKTAGNGIKIDNTTPTFGYRDILGDIKILSPGANDPTLATFRNGLKQFSFSNAVMNEAFCTYHIPHDYVPGSDIFLHFHWAQNVVDSGGLAGVPGDVKWQAEVSYAKGHDQAAFPASFTTSIVDTASGTQYQHIISEMQLSAASPSATQIDSDLLEPDGVILVRAFRDPTDVADTLNQVPFLHYVDIHYQSTNIATKAKAPDFYT